MRMQKRSGFSLHFVLPGSQPQGYSSVLQFAPHTKRAKSDGASNRPASRRKLRVSNRAPRQDAQPREPSAALLQSTNALAESSIAREREADGLFHTSSPLPHHSYRLRANQWTPEESKQKLEVLCNSQRRGPKVTRGFIVINPYTIQIYQEYNVIWCGLCGVFISVQSTGSIGKHEQSKRFERVCVQSFAHHCSNQVIRISPDSFGRKVYSLKLQLPFVKTLISTRRLAVFQTHTPCRANRHSSMKAKSERVFVANSSL